jgi:MoxR-like ATPase
MFEQIQRVTRDMQSAGYTAHKSLATTLVLSQQLGRPILLEGEAGVGKTAVAQALAKTENTELIRLQCFEGIDASAAVYEWNYARQLLSIKLNENAAEKLTETDIFSEQYLLERPLLKSITQEHSVVLLIDEVDRADEAFEAFLLEVLSDFSISVPELGTIRARSIPRVVLTSNGTRDLSDALRRRCLYHYIDYPSFDKELHILRSHMPDFDVQLLEQMTRFVQNLRKQDLRKPPGIAETLDWAHALCGWDIGNLPDHPDIIKATLSCLLKTRDDQEFLDSEQIELLLSASG